MKYIALILIHFFIFFSITAQNVSDELEKLKNDPDLKHASWGFCVRDAETGVIEYEYDANRSLVPASTMKAVTTMTALAILGSDHRFETYLIIEGAIDSAGTLNGNLIIVGTGDPTTGSSRFGSSMLPANVFDEFYQSLIKKGIKSIQGDIIAYDLNYEFNPVPFSWPWGDMGNYYGCGSYALNYNENLCHSFFKSSAKKGADTEFLGFDPALNNMKIYNLVKSGSAGSGDNTLIYSAPYGNTIIMEGTVPAGRSKFDVKASIPDPPLLFAQEFSGFLQEKGIVISGDNIRASGNLEQNGDKNNWDTIYRHLSPDLKSIVRKTNIGSINLYAECLLKRIAFIKRGKGIDRDAIAEVYRYWKNKGLDLNAFVMMDGSGLSRRNLISTAVLSQMLRTFRSESTYDDFLASLPLAGKDGSIGRLFKGTYAESNLRAKSGTMTGIRAYAGYVKNKSGKEKVFAVIVNYYSGSSYQMRSKLEKLMTAIAESQ